MENGCLEVELRKSGVFFPERYFPNFDEPFEEVVYPKGDSDAVSVSKRDFDLLQPDTFVNDTIIDFYIKYLKNKIQPEERHRFHFFNSFFFRKLADLDKDLPSAYEGRAAFQRVRKWTRKVDLFEKDYVFIPVNFSYHWSLMVMCHLGEVATFQDEDVKKSSKVPCILHLDSMRGTHTRLKDLVQSYLWEEWKERQKDASEDISSRFDNLRFVSLELPQQQNLFDCGLFLLHYVELFLEQAPVDFNPFKITKFSNFLNADWFEPAEASLKRVVIQRLISDLLENQSREETPAAGNDEQFTFNCQRTNIQKGTAVEVLPEKCSLPKACHKNEPSYQADQGIEISLFPSSSLKGSQCASDPGFVLRELFEPEQFGDAQYPTFNQTAPFDEFKSSMTPSEEEVDASGQFFYSQSTETGLLQLAGITPEARAFSSPSRDFRAGTSWNSGISGHQTGLDDIESSPETSTSTCDDSVEEVNENSPVDAPFTFEEKMDQPGSPLTEMSTEPVEMLSGHANGDPLTFFPENLPGSLSQYADMQENSQVDAALTFEEKIDQPGSPLAETSTEPVKILNGDATGDHLAPPENLPGSSSPCADMQEKRGVGTEDYLALDSDVQHVAKKMRLTPLEGEGSLTNSISDDLHL